MGCATATPRLQGCLQQVKKNKKQKTLPNTTNPGGVYVFCNQTAGQCADLGWKPRARVRAHPGPVAGHAPPPKPILPSSRGQIQPVGLRHMGIYNGAPGLLVMGLPEAWGRPPHSSGQGGQHQQKVLVLIL